MQGSTDNQMALQNHFAGPEGQNSLRIVQIATAAMLVGCLFFGAIFAYLHESGNLVVTKPNPKAAGAEPVADLFPAFPVLGILAVVVSLGGLAFGGLVLNQRRQANLALLGTGEGSLDPRPILSNSVAAWLVAGAMREGPLLMALLFATITDGTGQTICLGAAIAVLAWWFFHLPTRANFAHTLGLD